MTTSNEQFLKDVEAYEGLDIAQRASLRLPIDPSPFLALFNARREAHMPSLLAAQQIFAEKCDSTRD